MRSGSKSASSKPASRRLKRPGQRTKNRATNATRSGGSGKPSRARTRAQSNDWPDKFIAQLRKRGIVLDACKATHIDRSTAYRLKESSKEFSLRWKDALEDAGDVMEAEAFRRAVKGVRKPVYQGGKLVGYVQEYSDGLLTLMLKAHRPNEFRETTKVEHSGEIGVLTPQEIEQKRRERWKKVQPSLAAALSPIGSLNETDVIDAASLPEGDADAQ